MKNETFERVVRRGGIIILSPIRTFLVDSNLIGTIGRLDPIGLKFYPISNPEQVGYDVRVLDTHV